MSPDYTLELWDQNGNKTTHESTDIRKLFTLANLRAKEFGDEPTIVDQYGNEWVRADSVT